MLTGHVPRTFAQAIAQDEAHKMLTKRAKNPYVLPGSGNVDGLPKFPRAQRIVQRRVALEYGYEYTYVASHQLERTEQKH